MRRNHNMFQINLKRQFAEVIKAKAQYEKVVDDEEKMGKKYDKIKH